MMRAAVISYAGFAGVFLSSVAVSRLLGVEGKGIFSLFITTVNGLMIAATLGLPQGHLYHSSKNQEWLRHFMANAWHLSLLTGGVVALAYFLGGNALGFAQVTSLGPVGLVAGLVTVPLGVLQMYQRQYFLVMHRYEFAKAAGTVSLTLPLVGYLALYLSGHAGVNSFLVVYVSAQLLSFALFSIPAYQVGPAQARFSFELARRSLTFGARQFASDIALYLMSRVDFFIVLAFLGGRGLGIYSVASGLAEITTRLSNEIGTMLYPVFARGNLSAGQPAAALRMVTLMAAGTALVFEVLSGPIVRGFFGPAFADAIPALRWLMLGSVAYSTMHVTWTFVSAAGRPGFGALVFGVASVVDILLDLVLIPRWGVVGASVAATASYFVAATIFLQYFRKLEGCSIRQALIANWSDVKQLRSAALRAVGIFRSAAAPLPTRTNVS